MAKNIIALRYLSGVRCKFGFCGVRDPSGRRRLAPNRSRPVSRVDCPPHVRRRETGEDPDPRDAYPSGGFLVIMSRMSTTPVTARL